MSGEEQTVTKERAIRVAFSYACVLLCEIDGGFSPTYVSTTLVRMLAGGQIDLLDNASCEKTFKSTLRKICSTFGERYEDHVDKLIQFHQTPREEDDEPEPGSTEGSVS